MVAALVVAPSVFGQRQSSQSKRKAVTQVQSSFAKPDFAYPQTVAKDADKVLKDAVSTPIEKVQAAIQITAANNSISVENVPSTAATIDSLAKVLPTPYSQIMYSIEAQLYVDYYNYNGMQRSDARTTTDADSPALWDKDAFTLKVMELARCSLAGQGVDTPLATIAALLAEYGSPQGEYYPAVYDLLAYRALDLLNAFASNQAVIPFSAEAAQSQPPAQQAYTLRQEIIDGLIDRYADNPKPLSRAVIAKYSNADRAMAYEGYSYWQQRTANDPGTMAFVYMMGEVLPETENVRKEFYALASNMLERHPKADYSPGVRNCLSAMSVKVVTVKCDGVALVGKPLTVTAKSRNTNRYYLLLFKTEGQTGEDNYVKLSDITSKPVEVIAVSPAGTVPFTASDSVSFGITHPLTPGYYAVVASDTQSISGAIGGRRQSVGLIRVGSTSAFTVNGGAGENGSLYVVYAEDGKPVQGAEVGYYSRQWNKRNTLLLKNKTNSDGVSKRPEEWAEARIRHTGKQGTEVFSMSVNGAQRSSSSPRRTTHATILTDLSIYHPNDTVQFAVVAYNDSANNLSIASQLPVNMVLYDANNQQVGDTLRVVTDTDGRAAGRLPINSTGPTGTYRISVTTDKNHLANTFFTVAEYVAPTFFVETDTISMEQTMGTPVTVRGKVQTYSGMPLAGATVNMIVNYRRLYWWRYDANPAAYGASTVTNDKGEYSFTLSTKELEGTRFAKGVFEVSVTATSPSGESQAAAPTAFILGKGYRLVTQIPSRLSADGQDVTFTAEAQNALGTSQPMEVSYVLTNTVTGRTVSKGSFTAPTLSVASSTLPSGSYKLQLTLAGDTSVNATANTIIYRTTDKRVPGVNTTLWVPQTQITVQPGAEKVKVNVGSSYPDSYVLMEVGSSDGRILETRWLRCGQQMQTIEVSAPHSDERIWVRFHATHNFIPAIETVQINPAVASKALDIKVVSFRDKLLPGAKEQWEFTLMQTGIDLGTIGNAPAFAVMSNQALNALVNFRWSFSPRDGLWWRNPLGGDHYDRYNPATNFSTTYKSLKQPFISVPEINFYGMPLSGRLEYGGYNRSLMTKSAAPRVRGKSNNESSTTNIYAVVEQEVMMDSAPAMGAVQEMKLPGAETTEEAAAEAVEGSAQQPQMRKVECPLAFFMPNLSTDAQGNLKVSFTTPNFNTTWQLQLLAYDKQLYTASKLMTAIASKPVMVQSTTPRFLRTDDRPVLTAMAFNNTDTAAVVGGYMEIFDPATGNVLQRKEFPAEALAPKASRLFVIDDITTPDTVQMLGVRSVASSGNYSDGEQVLIGVVPSSTPVIDAVPFYLSPKDTVYSLQLPEFKDDGVVTLQFTDNPVWYCVTALPNISVPQSDCLHALLYAAFGNELAASLVEKNPAIAQAIQVWSQTASSALTSPLLKDNDLKTIALQQTIWVQNANSETLRMMALDELLDPAKSAAASKAIIEKISSLQASNGGWSWLPDMEPSLYMTTQVLSTFGHLKALGVTIGKDAEKMLNKGVSFADQEVYEVYQESLKHKGGFPTTLMLDYFSIRSEYNVPLPRKMQTLRSLTLSHVAKEWRSMDMSRQATAAIFLHSNGRAKEAGNIMESLRQRASRSSQKGMWYDNLRGVWSGDGPLLTTAGVLEAFATITPDAPDVDLLRQWLVLQRQTQNWGDNRMIAEVVYAILTTGSKWIAPAKPAAITVGGKTLKPNTVEALTGSLTMTLDAKEVSGAELNIHTAGGHPAWGGVIQQYIAPIIDVKAASVPDLTIDKQVYVVETTPEGEKLRLVDDASLVVGQRVRISLTLTAGRDFDYVAVTDSRSACLQPVDQLSGYMRQGNSWFYYEPRNEVTNLFAGTLTKGAHVLTYDCYVQQAGLFSLGIATAQSQYAPVIVAHSGGVELKVTEQ